MDPGIRDAVTMACMPLASAKETKDLTAIIQSTRVMNEVRSDMGDILRV